MNKYSFIFVFLKPKDDKKITQVYTATLQLVKDKGVAGVTMSDIAHKAGIATGTLYIYFKSKEDLINALFLSCRASSAGIYFKDYDPLAPFKEGFKTIWMNIVRHRQKHFEEAIFLEQCYHSPFIAESNKETSKKMIQPLFKLIERGRKEKIIRDADTVLLLTFMIGSVNEMVKHAHYHGTSLSKTQIATAFEMCWNGMKK